MENEHVILELDLPEDDVFYLMRCAHEVDLTLNQYVESILRTHVHSYELADNYHDDENYPGDSNVHSHSSEDLDSTEEEDEKFNSIPRYQTSTQKTWWPTGVNHSKVPYDFSSLDKVFQDFNKSSVEYK